MYISIKKFGQYEGKWVALNSSNEAILASGNSVIAVQKKLSKNEQKKSILRYILPFTAKIAPSST